MYKRLFEIHFQTKQVCFYIRKHSLRYLVQMLNNYTSQYFKKISLFMSVEALKKYNNLYKINMYQVMYFILTPEWKNPDLLYMYIKWHCLICIVRWHFFIAHLTKGHYTHVHRQFLKISTCTVRLPTVMITTSAWPWS